MFFLQTTGQERFHILGRAVRKRHCLTVQRSYSEPEVFFYGLCEASSLHKFLGSAVSFSYNSNSRCVFVSIISFCSLSLSLFSFFRSCFLSFPFLSFPFLPFPSPSFPFLPLHPPFLPLPSRSFLFLPLPSSSFLPSFLACLLACLLAFFLSFFLSFCLSLSLTILLYSDGFKDSGWKRFQPNVRFESLKQGVRRKTRSTVILILLEPQAHR